MDFTDVPSSEVKETEAADADYGDGDGVNEFDETYNEMNMGQDTIELEKTDSAGPPETETPETPETPVNPDMQADEVLSDFDEDAEKTARFENVSYQQGQNDLGAYGTCGPTSIANSLNRVTGTTEYTENRVLHSAMEKDLCSKSDNPELRGGTTTKDVVAIIEDVKDPESNIQTEVYEYDNALSVDELADRLDDPGTVAMVGVDSASLWDQRGDVASSGLFQHTDAPSDHWITVDSPVRDDKGEVIGFNIIDSGGGVDYVDRDKFEAMYKGDMNHTVTDPTAVIITNNGEHK